MKEGYESYQRPFFLGIGGSGMSSLAFLLLSKGMKVSGYDGKISDTVSKLIEDGAQVLGKDDVLKADDYDLAVYSSAIRLDSHPLVKKFKDEGIPLLHRSALLHEVMSEKKQISVAGSHGKTTTTAMTAFLLERCGASPSVMVGGEVAFLNGRGGRWGKGAWAVFESDESDGTFNNHDASVRILTNVDEDHLDYYQNRTNLLNAFARYMEKARDRLILNLDDVGIRDSVLLLKDRSRILGFSSASDPASDPFLSSLGLEASQIVSYTIEGQILRFNFQKSEYSFSLKYPGEHYLKNALAGILAASEAGSKTEQLVSVVGDYSGVSRRLEYLGNRDGVEVYDDYGHHPTEIKAVIRSMEGLKKDGRAVILFQPHRYTRTQNLYREFASSLDLGEKVYLLPIYSAGENPMEGVETEMIAAEMRTTPEILPKKIEEGIPILRRSLRPGDKLVTLGAGNVRDWGIRFLEY
ncbi:UDP-N-acetylmuramate--L-alanine ligase [Leptospira gomenensis]|uniref:UDP-N-acetylmuramate--L-alanine ligase n=1 Tax=Leptospira gomenensis TaxID=2484974 RepID=A0A5F1YB23_9LEPT|nr:UDP-N-acetylmuramate--L-alanine ligase [Leptospira gomenensis]TGK34465.1 UDP-N-acetylmuramate--L-alanine ligase [Leptospira gomenensis]TGK41851.1 UDP-N-acetylmuramate--L-alanine ligase [Leptospira gomenensis]TGK44788.1 UDP-N-acetylmuramate--L-alanine ligase [Leptospira gomenensis]TGK65175.1 UDP-N-acetylmuramate--L-alanine ligase [Leptospira gomenensis]